MRVTIPQALAANPHARRSWLDGLPALIEEFCARWSLEPGEPFEGGTAAWVAPVLRTSAACASGSGSGRSVVLKLAMPHMEARHEIQGLRHWNGDGMVPLLEADSERQAMLLERCEPGTPLRDEAEPFQDEVIADLLKRLWRTPPESHPFRPLAELTAHWAAYARARTRPAADESLVSEGLRLFDELPRSAEKRVLLATDLHAGNVLKARRESWLAIDPKPFVGDPAYDTTQHLFNCRERLRADPLGLIQRMGDLTGIDCERIRLWTFARLALNTTGSDASADRATARTIAA